VAELRDTKKELFETQRRLTFELEGGKGELRSARAKSKPETSSAKIDIGEEILWRRIEDSVGGERFARSAKLFSEEQRERGRVFSKMIEDVALENEMVLLDPGPQTLDPTPWTLDPKP
jgi:hypothetical protein